MKDPEFRKIIANQGRDLKEIQADIENSEAHIRQMDEEYARQLALIKSQRSTSSGSISLSKEEIESHIVSRSMGRRKINEMPTICQNVVDAKWLQWGSILGFHEKLGWFIRSNDEVLWSEKGFAVNVVTKDKNIEEEDSSGNLEADDIGTYDKECSLLDFEIGEMPKERPTPDVVSF